MLDPRGLAGCQQPQEHLLRQVFGLLAAADTTAEVGQQRAAAQRVRLSGEGPVRTCWSPITHPPLARSRSAP